MQIEVKKCGVRFKPPAVTIIYSKNGKKLHRRTMPLRFNIIKFVSIYHIMNNFRNFSKNSGVSRVAEDLRNTKRHKVYLEKLPLHQLEKMISLIKDQMNGISLHDSLKREAELSHVDGEEDLNKVPEDVLKRKKATMDEEFQKNRVKPGDKNFQYNKEVDFGGAIETCGWDDSSDDEGF